MQLTITHKAEPEIVLPINYHHIMQSIIYNGISSSPEYASQVHDQGYRSGKRSYKMFQFSQLKGRYRIEQKKIIFFEEITFEVRSVDAAFILALKESFEQDGICYGQQRIKDVKVYLSDDTVEDEDILINMKTPITVHATDRVSRKTFFYRPEDDRFAELVNDNFKRKYKAYTGIVPTESIQIEVVRYSEKDKYVTNYKGFYISGWYGRYRLRGKRKYLDFLYQTGIGDRNSQGFGMFDITGTEV